MTPTLPEHPLFSEVDPRRPRLSVTAAKPTNRYSIHDSDCLVLTLSNNTAQSRRRVHHTRPDKGTPGESRGRKATGLRRGSGFRHRGSVRHVRCPRTGPPTPGTVAGPPKALLPTVRPASVSGPTFPHAAIAFPRSLDLRSSVWAGPLPARRTEDRDGRTRGRRGSRD